MINIDPPTLSEISRAEYAFITDGTACDYRVDGRTRTARLPRTIDWGNLPGSLGSARLQKGGGGLADDTDIIIGVRAEAKRSTEVDAGRVIFNVDCTSDLSLEANDRASDDLGFFISSLIRDLTLNPSTVPPKSLDISPPGFFRWTLYVDAIILASGGNILDDVSLGVLAALRSTKLPAIEVVADQRESSSMNQPGITFQVDECPETGTDFPFENIPLLVTAGCIKGSYLWDMSSEEELCATTKLTAAVSAKGKCVGVHRHGGNVINMSALESVLEISETIGKETHTNLDVTMTGPMRCDDTQ
eukprot:GHVO01017143.1.p1 GENE.GHVO01017143.1~~GHVO01017143.1.p1  ORF type:complete len:310 (+),score=61.64 GHVO01017143.1:24-932(+)